MEILVYDIPAKGLDLTIDAARDVWLARVLGEALGDAFAADDRAVLTLRVERVDEDVDIRGTLDMTLHSVCDRCLGVYREKVSLPVRVHMTPLYESERQRERESCEGADTDIVRDDLEFSYYEGDRIHLDEMIAEQVVLAQPMKHLCSEACKGLCQRCGKNLNEGPCGCHEQHTDSRWEALKDFRPSRRRHTKARSG